MNKLWVETFVLEFTNEIPDDNEDTTEDDVREPKHSWRHCENCEKKKNPFLDFIDVKDRFGSQGGY